ncbi:MAG TPA: hypothetical protein VIX35_11120 [Vicinamibacterales bacterium]
MYFKEFLRVRNALVWYLVVLALIGIVTSLITMGSGEASITVGAVPKHPVPKVEDLPWVALFGFAGFFAAIMSTVFGSTLAQENRHLELAWTKPQSRTRYATALMSIDALGLFIAQLAAFALILGHIAVFHHGQIRVVARPDDTVNVVRFLLFPLAWYGIIVAFSASLREGAGIVQALIWPIALGFTGLAEAPLPAIWHRIFDGFNLINPLAYVTYHDPGPDVNVLTTAGFANVILAVTVLGLIVVVSWFAATYQWRRLQVQ